MKILMTVLIVCLAFPSSALAVRKVEKKPKPQASSAKQAVGDQNQQADEKNVKNDQSPSVEQPKPPLQAAPEIKAPEKEDRFIDENRDGINDRMGNRPAVKTRKKEEPPRRETPGRDSAEEKAPNKIEKKNRRDR